MRYDRIFADDCSEFDVTAAAWPATATFAPIPVAEIERAASDSSFLPTPAAPDVPSAVGKMIVAAYAALIAAFALATARSLDSVFMISISALFVAVFFTVPRVFFAVEPKIGKRPGIQRFMREGMETYTGHSSGGAALVQMLIVPVFLTVGILAIGVAATFVM